MNKPSTEDTRTKILKAATKVLAEHGYQKATISQITSLAGLSDATVYDVL